MNNLSANKIKKIEFYSIFINNIFLLLGIVAFGWTLFETLFLYWLELIAACLVRLYVDIRTPLKYGRPGQLYVPDYKKAALKTVLLSILTLIMHSLVLLFLIDLAAIPGWSTASGYLHALLQTPVQLWEGDMLLLCILFLIVYLLPPIMNERRGIQPSYDNLPIQTKIMTHESQFLLSYLLFGLLALLYYYLSVHHALVLVAVLMIVKSVYEAILFRFLDV